MENKNNEDVLEISLLDIVHSIKSHLGVIIALGVLFLAVAVAYLVFCTVPVYESKVSMIVNPLKNTSSLADLTEGFSSGNANITTETSLITSNTNLKNALSLLDLTKYQTPDEELYEEYYKDSENIRKLIEKVTVTTESNSRRVQISVKDTDMAFACDYANAVAQSYKDYLAFLSKDSKIAQRETIERQIPENEEMLNVARESLAKFNAEYGTSQIQSKIEVLNPQISLIQLQKDPLEIEIEKNKALIPSYFLVTVPKNQDIADLVAEYCQIMKEYLLYQNVNSATTTEARALSLSTNLESKSQEIYAACLATVGTYEVAKPLADYLTVSAKYDVLSELEEGYVAELAGYQGTIVQLQELESNVAIYESIVLSLKQMLEETKVLESSVESSVIIVDTAEINEEPVSPKKLLISAVSLFVGLLAGVALGLYRDLSDVTITSESKVHEILGEEVTSLGWIPYSKALPGDSKFYVIDDPDGYTAERYRMLSSNISLVTENKGLKVFTICSTDRSEGKSTATVNVASNFASLGKKVLIIDGDLRRPEMENYLNIAHAKLGLADIVFGKATKEQVILRPLEKLPTLHLLPAGMGMNNPNVVFNSESFKNLLQNLRKAYDYIFIDCPPLSFGSDFIFISKSVDAYVLNIRAGATTRPALYDYVEQKKTITAPLLGYIFYGRIMGQNSSGYGYGYNSYSYDNNKKKDNAQRKESYREIRKKEIAERSRHSVRKNLVQAPLAYEAAKPVQPAQPKVAPATEKAEVKETEKQKAIEDAKPIQL